MFISNIRCRTISLIRRCCTGTSTEHGPKELHIPVMVDEAINYLNIQEGQVVLDMTFGAGGHSRKLLEYVPNLKLLALDRDPKAFSFAEKLSAEFPEQVTPMLGRFSDIPVLLKQLNIKQSTIDGILFDFGCSSMQFDEADRGFSVSKNGPLDMRMDGNRSLGNYKFIKSSCLKKVSYPFVATSSIFHNQIFKI